MASKDYVIKNITADAGDPSNESKWVSQFKVKKQKFDIATHHSIKFYDGAEDEDGTSWNGTSDLEVVIPDVKDFYTKSEVNGLIANAIDEFASFIGLDASDTIDDKFVSEEEIASISDDEIGALFDGESD